MNTFLINLISFENNEHDILLYIFLITFIYIVSHVHVI